MYTFKNLEEILKTWRKFANLDLRYEKTHDDSRQFKVTRDSFLTERVASLYKEHKRKIINFLTCKIKNQLPIISCNTEIIFLKILIKKHFTNNTFLISYLQFCLYSFDKKVIKKLKSLFPTN